MNRLCTSILCVLVMLVTAVIPMTYSAGAENESNYVGDEDTNSCTGFYVGSAISADGTTIIGQTADNSAYRPGWYEHIDAVKDVSGRQVKGSNGFVYNLPSSTYGYTTYYTGVNDGKGSWGGSTMNDQGLAYTGAISAKPNDTVKGGDPFIKNGVSEEFLGHLVAMCCATADEAIDFIINLVKENGIDEGSIFMVADQTKTWYIECFTGHQYVAIVLPEDKMATFGNDFNILSVNEGKTGTTAKVSDNLLKVAKDTGSCVPATAQSVEEMNINASYAEAGREGISLRAWRGHCLFGGLTDDYDPDVDYPLLFSSTVGKISVKQMMDFTRDRCQGTKYCPDTTGEQHRVVAVEFIVEAYIIQVHKDLPKDMCLVGWGSLAPPEFGVYVPMSNLSTGFIKEFSTSPGNLHIDATTMYGMVKKIASLCSGNRNMIGDAVKEYWSSFENYCIDIYPKVLEEMKKLHDKSSSDASEYATRHAKTMQEIAYEKAFVMYEECCDYVIRNTSVMKTAEEMKMKEPLVDVKEFAARYGWSCKTIDNGISLTDGKKTIVIKETSKDTRSKCELIVEGSVKEDVRLFHTGDSYCIPLSEMTVFSSGHELVIVIDDKEPEYEGSSNPLLLGILAAIFIIILAYTVYYMLKVRKAE